MKAMPDIERRVSCPVVMLVTVAVLGTICWGIFGWVLYELYTYATIR